MPWDRYKLNKLLDQMVELSSGTLIYEVALKLVIADEVDQGFYQDSSLTPAEFATFLENLQRKARQQRLVEEEAII